MEALCVDNVVSGLTSCGLWRASTLKRLVNDQWLSSKFLESVLCPPYEVSFFFFSLVVELESHVDTKFSDL